jgi:hypothetical protein
MGEMREKQARRRKKPASKVVGVDYSGDGPGGIFGFTPESIEVSRAMRRLFPDASWLGPTMYTEQRYAYDVGEVLQAQLGAELVRREDRLPIESKGGHFFLKAAAS